MRLSRSPEGQLPKESPAELSPHGSAEIGVHEQHAAIAASAAGPSQTTLLSPTDAQLPGQDAALLPKPALSSGLPPRGDQVLWDVYLEDVLSAFPGDGLQQPPGVRKHSEVLLLQAAQDSLLFQFHDLLRS